MNYMYYCSARINFYHFFSNKKLPIKKILSLIYADLEINFLSMFMKKSNFFVFWKSARACKGKIQFYVLRLARKSKFLSSYSLEMDEALFHTYLYIKINVLKDFGPKESQIFQKHKIVKYPSLDHGAVRW